MFPSAFSSGYVCWLTVVFTFLAVSSWLPSDDAPACRRHALYTDTMTLQAKPAEGPPVPPGRGEGSRMLRGLMLSIWKKISTSKIYIQNIK